MTFLSEHELTAALFMLLLMVFTLIKEENTFCLEYKSNVD